jgi:hypothetical protein
VSIAPQVTGSCNADDTGTDDGDVLGHALRRRGLLLLGIIDDAPSRSMQNVW